MQDDSIYRDFHWARDELLAAWAAAEPHLTSDLAIRIYALLGALFVLALSVFLSYRLMSKLKGIEDAAFVLKPRGRKPMRPEAVKDAQDRLLQFRKIMWRSYFLTLLVFLVCGFLIPSAGLYFGGAYYGWFDPFGTPFVSLHGGEPVTVPHSTELALFILNQLTHGALMDFLEVFHLDFGAIANNPANYPFSFAVFVYRSFVGTFAFALLFFLRRATIIAWRMPSVEALFPTPDQAKAA